MNPTPDDGAQAISPISEPERAYLREVAQRHLEEFDYARLILACDARLTAETAAREKAEHDWAEAFGRLRFVESCRDDFLVLAQRHQARAETAEKERDDLRAKLAEAEAIIGNKSQLITLRDAMAERDAAIRERDEALATKDIHKARQQEEIARADAAEAERDDLRTRLAEALDKASEWHAGMRDAMDLRYSALHERNVALARADKEIGWCKVWRDRVNGAESREQAALAERDAHAATIARLREAKDGAYTERNALVCAISKLFPSWLGLHGMADLSWDPEWRNIVFVQLPTGQASWHIHDRELPLFAHLKHGDGQWDGHSTDEKYQRIAALAANPEAKS